MRTLSETEIQTIQTRLDRCLIAYQEIYDELLDHYISALEQVPVEVYLQKKEELDNTFSWSVIRGMEKALEKSARKEFLRTARSSYKIWTLGWKKLSILLVVGLLFTPVFLLTGPEGTYIVSALVLFSMVGFSLYFNKTKYGFSWSLAPGVHKPRYVLAHQFFGSHVFIFGITNLFAQLLPKLLENTSFAYLTPYFLLLFSMILLTFCWVIFNAINLKTLKLIKY
ncbi:hypothetical protein [Mongoliitalea lutea]|uniref:Uncharacterized protein n=1 Tax=Mongoliitalea lutea TaxID=849756 RepID=A0A8J3CXJ8_9BACT|nr:hypothetical protein [Mongoliitalea lutea]GHB34486.1 hypothetical protein GCM10008106_14840 [Mongoliitalea lutea]